jgi:hypothetical protein
VHLKNVFYGGYVMHLGAILLSCSHDILSSVSYNCLCPMMDLVILFSIFGYLF